MKKIISISSLLLVTVFYSFSLSNYTDSEIEDVLSKMKLFYISNPISMSYVIEYTKIDGTKQLKNKSTLNLNKDSYLMINKKEINLKNKFYTLFIDKQDKTIFVAKVEDKKLNFSPVQNKNFLKFFENKNITSTHKDYIIELIGIKKKITIVISKLDYHLKEYSYSLDDDDTYKKISARYSNVKINKKLNSDFFSENRYIIKARKSFVCAKNYKNYKLIDKTH